MGRGGGKSVLSIVEREREREIRGKDWRDIGPREVKKKEKNGREER